MSKVGRLVPAVELSPSRLVFIHADAMQVGQYMRYFIASDQFVSIAFSMSQYETQADYMRVFPFCSPFQCLSTDLLLRLRLTLSSSAESIRSL